MKRTVRILSSLLFIVMLIFAVTVLSASATEADEYDVVYSVEAGASTVKAGDVINLKISLATNKGFKYSKVSVDFSDLPVTYIECNLNGSVLDSDVLEVRLNKQDSIFNINIGNLMTAIFTPDAAPTIDATGLIATVSFKVNADFDGNIKFTALASQRDIIPASLNVRGDEVEIYSVSESHVHTVVDIPEVPATCTETGLTAGSKCATCGTVLKEQETTGALGHDEVSHEAKAATCTEKGWEAYVTCSRCDYTTYKEIGALGHDEVSHEAKAATCTEKGWEAYVTCKRCDYTTYKEINALGHTEVADPAKAATCTETGLTEGKHCSVCEAVFVKQEEVAALGHTYGEWTVVKEATKKAEGLQEKVCTVCGDKVQETIPMLKSGCKSSVSATVVVVVIVSALGTVAVFKKKD